MPDSNFNNSGFGGTERPTSAPAGDFGAVDPQKEIMDSNEQIRVALVQKYPDAFMEEHTDVQGNPVSPLKGVRKEVLDKNNQEAREIVEEAFKEKGVPYDGGKHFSMVYTSIVEEVRQIVPVISKYGEGTVIKSSIRNGTMTELDGSRRVSDIRDMNPEGQALLSARLKILSSDFAKEPKMSAQEFVDLI